MLLKISAYLCPIFGLVVIGLVTYLRNPRNKLYVLFFWVALSMAAWLAALMVGDLLISPTISLWAVRVATCVGTLIVPTMLYFGRYFPVKLYKIGPVFHLLAILPAGIFMALALTPWLIPSVDLADHQSAQPDGLGVLYTLQSLYFVIGMAAAVFVVLSKWQRLNARQRAQVRIVLIGFLIALITNIATGFFLTVAHQSTGFSNFAGSLSLLVFIGATAYAIIRHHLFDLRLAVVRALGFTVTVGLVSIAYTLLVLGIGVPLIATGHVTLIQSDPQLLWFLPPTLVAALTFHRLQRIIARLTQSLFYHNLYDTQMVLDKFSDALISDYNLHNIVASGLSVIREALRPSHTLFVVIGRDSAPSIEQLEGRSEPANLSMLVENARRLKGRVLAKDQMPTGQWQREFEEEDISLVLRLGSSKNPIGILFFGPKRSGQLYNKQDIELLNLIAKNFAIAIENAQKYQQIAEFADTMHAEVLRATASLRRANSKLKTLDAMKDDFISMASHQLRSPAASVHDAIEMLEQPYLTTEERQRIIELAGASSERLLNVITDMLSVARIQAGHFTIEKSSVDLTGLAKRAIMQASALAAEKHITTQLDGPDKPHSIMADRAKMNEIMANLIENGIKYSPEGSQLKVSVRQEQGRTYFEVADQGIGVAKAERKNLFHKFYRAPNARVEHPNGNGIGLFVVKTVVELHQGGVYYQPLPDGSLFGFWLPSDNLDA